MPIEKLVMRQFPYTLAYITNVTLSGSLCYVESAEEFYSGCLEKDPLAKSWIVTTPFDYSKTNEILGMAQDLNIEGVIIEYDA